jgi:hypothetical protein
VVNASGYALLLGFYLGAFGSLLLLGQGCHRLLPFSEKKFRVLKRKSAAVLRPPPVGISRRRQPEIERHQIPGIKKP